MDLAIGAIQRLHRPLPCPCERVHSRLVGQAAMVWLREHRGNRLSPVARIIRVADGARSAGYHVFPRPSGARDNDRQSTRLCLEYDIACGVGRARKHKAIGGGKDFGDTLARQGASEYGVREQLAERRQQRPVTSDDESMLDADPVKTI